MSPRAWLAPVGAAWFATAAGCFSPELTPGLPCAIDHDPPCPEGQVCDMAANTCVPDSSLGTWRDDTAADFGDPAAVLDEAAVEANGAVGPRPYLVEAVAIYGIDDQLIGDGNQGDVPWDDIAAAPIAGRGFARGELDLSFGGAAAGTGLPNVSGATIRIEGEIFLPAGANDLDLDCDDRCFFDLGDPAGRTFTRVIAAEAGPSEAGTAIVPAAGWYPFRAAVEGDTGSIQFDLEQDDEGDLSSIDADRLRARVDDIDGLSLDGFDDPYLHAPTGTTLSTAALGQRQDYDTDSFPSDLGDLGVGTWSVRWSGQVLVAVAGAYAFRLDTAGGHRMWLDGAQVADTTDAGPDQITTTAPVQLDAGWHDVAIDLMKDSDSSTPSYFQITVESGPELVGSFFPLERMRPVTGRGARWAANDSFAEVPVPDAMSATKSVFLGLPDGVDTAQIVDYAFAFTHPLRATVSVAFDRPGASQTTIIPAGTLGGAGGYDDRLRFDDVQGDGTWELVVTDTAADVMTGSITSAQVAATYAGGTAPFPTTARYTSRVRDLGPVVAYSGVRWQTRQAAPGQIVVSVRSCDDATCESVPWTPVAASGDVAGLEPRPFAQYQIDITTDGDLPAALDWIEIDYRLP